MFENVIQVNKNIIKVYYYINIEKVIKYIIYKLLENYRGVSKAKRYNCLFKEFVASIEICILFVAFYNIH